MTTTYKSQKLEIPSENKFEQIFYWLASLVIDLGPVTFPLIVLNVWLYFALPLDLFYIFYIPALIIAIYWLCVTFVNFYSIKINKFEFEDPKIRVSKTFVFISDLHIGKSKAATNIIKLRKIIKKLNSIEKEFIIFGGDQINNEFEIEMLNELRKIKGRKIAILGNHDSHYLNRGQYTKETPVRMINYLTELGFEVLINNGMNIGDDLFIGGIKDLYTRDFDFEKAFEGSTNDQYKILLSHNPDVISYKDELGDVELILSGHNHAGQINFLGLHLPMPSMRQWLIKGIYKISDTTTLLLSQGVGATKTRVRIGTDFEICLIKLMPTASK